MLKKSICILMILALILCSASILAFATTGIDNSKSGSLSLDYSLNGNSIPDVDVKIYRVATVSSDAFYTLRGEFKNCSVNLNDNKTTAAWVEDSNEVYKYVLKNSIEPLKTGKSGDNGKCIFSSLKTGLYLVVSSNLETSDFVYSFDTFLISVPNSSGGTWNYDVKANPKAEATEKTPREIEYTITILWDDDGLEDRRPDEVLAEIFKDEEKEFEVILSPENDWSFAWTTIDDGSEWIVVIDGVPMAYAVSDLSFGRNTVIECALKEAPPPEISTSDAPHTGDANHPEVYFLLLIVSGVSMIVIGKKRQRCYAN